MSRISYEIINQILNIESDHENSIQLNLMKWGSNPEKLDLRKWNSNGEPQKGFTLTEDELLSLYENLKEYFGDVEEEISFAPEPEERVIDYRSVIVVDNMANCQLQGHDMENVNAILFTRGRDGQVYEWSVGVTFCLDCGAYYISKTYFDQIAKEGRILCQVFTDYNKFNKYKTNERYSNLQPEGVLKMAGYSVSQLDNLSESERRNILLDVIDSGLKEKKEVISFLSWLIKQNENNSLKQLAVKKWRSDRDWLMGNQPTVRGRSIAVKYIIKS